MTRRITTPLLAAVKSNWLVAAGLLIPVLILYRRLLFENQTWLDFDFLLTHSPRAELLQSGIRSGSVPLWADGFLGGFPVPFSEFGWFYPVTWLFLALFPMPLAYHAQTAFGLLLAAISAYWLARTWGLNRTAGFLAAHLYVLGPFLFTTSRFLNYADIAFVLPAGIAAIEKIARGQLLFVPVLAIIVAVAIIAGHPQMAMIYISATGAYSIFCAVQLGRGGGIGTALRFVGWLAFALVVALAADAPRLLPVFAVTAESPRAHGLDFTKAATGSASPWGLLLGYLYPSFDIPRVLNGHAQAESLTYSGLLAIPLVTLAAWTRRKQPTVVFLCGLAAGAMVLALGSFTPLFEILHRLPLWEFFRAPSRFMVVVAFAFAFLSGYGLQALLKESTRRLRITRVLSRLLVWHAVLIFGASIVVTIVLSTSDGPLREFANRGIDRFVVGGRDRFASAGEYYGTFDVFTQRLEAAFSLTSWIPVFTIVAAILSAMVIWAYVRRKISPRTAVAAATVVLAVDLFFSLGHEIDTMPVRYFHAASETLNSPAFASSDRVLSYRGLADKWELSIGTGDRLNQTQRNLIEYLFMRQVLTPNLAMRSGLTSIDGYENLMSRRQAEIISYLGSERSTVQGFATDPHSTEREKASILRERLPVLAAFGVNSVLSGTPIHDSLGEPADSIDVEFPDWSGVDQIVWIYHVPKAAETAYLTGYWRRDDPDLPTKAILESLASSPPGTVFLDGDPGFLSRESDPGGRLLNAHSSNGSHVYEVEVDRVSLFIANSFITRGWKAEVDGRLVPYMTANRFGAAVVLTPGRHRVRFSYSPPNWTIARGLGLAGGASLALMAGAATVVTVRSRWTANRNGLAAED